MSYSSFTLASALDQLKIALIVDTEKPNYYSTLSQEFQQKIEFTPSSLFQKDFAFGSKIYKETVFRSEAMLNSLLIRPFLWEVWERHPNLCVWQEASLDVDAIQNLMGTPDYCITPKSRSPKAPYCIIMEAKQDNFDKEWGQTLAAMRGAQILNKRESSLEIAIYGVVTNGVLWHFGKLTGNEFILFPPGFISVFEPENPVLKILTLLDIIFSQCEMIGQSKPSQ